MLNRFRHLLTANRLNLFTRRYYKPSIANQFSSLFNYTEKNRALIHKLKKFSKKNKSILSLRAAIQQGDADAPVFSDPKCYLYVLYLLRRNLLPFFEGVNVYIYLIALMQFTQKQTMDGLEREAHSSKENLFNFAVKHLSKMGKLTQDGENYLNTVILEMGRVGVKMNFDEFANQVLSLSPADNWLISCDLNETKPNDYVSMTKLLLENIPFLGWDRYSKNNYFIPSLNVIRYILSKVSPLALELQPVIGLVNAEKFQLMHRTHIHPIPLYLPASCKNLVDPHGYYCGPFTTILHDIGHTLWGSLLRVEDRNKLFETFVPLLQLLQEEAKQHARLARKICLTLASKIEHAIERAYDFNLTFINEFDDTEKRFVQYIAKTFRNNDGLIYPYWNTDQTIEYTTIGECQEDHLYFLLHQFYYHPKLSAEEKSLWKEMLDYINCQLTLMNRSPEVRAALRALAQMSAGVLPDATPEIKTYINWDKWLALLADDIDSKMLWQVAKDEMQSQLLALITEHHVKFFHPIFPLTKQQLLELEKYICHQASLCPSVDTDSHPKRRVS